MTIKTNSNRSMKKYSLYIASLALAAVAFTSCDNEFERPPMVLPTSSWQANTTIEDFKAAYWETVEGTPQTIGLTADGDSMIIKGRVCSSDESSNIFKALYVQSTDEADGEALTFVLDFYDIYQTYKLGQEIYVNLTGLTVGGYRGLMQVGIDNAGQVGRAPEATFALHAQGNGLPSIAKLDTITTSISAVETAKTTPEGLRTWQGRLVRFDNVHFENAGEPFAVGTTSNSRYVIDEGGNRINVYNSTYADFKDEPLPSGNGSVVGILSYFGSNWQVLLNGIDGCIDFNGVAAPVFSPASGAVKPGTEVTITCATDEAEIHYTLDGSDPTISSTLYTEPIVINEAVVIKAIATKPGHDASTIVTATFTVSENAPAEGDGTEASPYTVAQVIALNPTSTKDAVATDVWAQGYIVGYIPTGGSSTTLSFAVFGADANAAASNIVVAPSKDETNPANCMAIQLASGSDVRSAANLKDHPENLGKLLTVKGSVYKYCDAPGIKDVTAFKLEGEGSGTVTPEPTPADKATFKAATSITSGKKYAIVADNKAGISFGTKTYGYINVIDVTIADGTFSGDIENSFTFTQTEGGYTIQGDDNRYLYMTGTYNSFNLDATKPATGAVWTVTFADNKATITNVEMKKTIQFDSQYNSFGSYSDSRGTLPTLYELVD